MNGENRLKDAIKAAVQSAENNAPSTVTPFSRQAYSEFWRQTEVYLVELAGAAYRRMKHHRTDQISATDVRAAARHLVRPLTTWRAKAALAFGGISAGIASSLFIDITAETSPVSKDHAITFGVTLAFGIAAILYGILKE